jgi:hypothetical protein
MNQDSIISKIRKCLALSKSSNEHEAAVALRQAQALMDKHRIDEGTLLAAEASEAFAKSGAKKTPVSWENSLAGVIGSAFGCKVIFHPRHHASGLWGFLGTGPAPDIAQYAFETLLRQAKKARLEFIKSRCRRATPTNKTKRADLFCTGWVQAIYKQVQHFAGADKNQAAIDAYTAKRYPSLTTLQSKDRHEGKSLKDRDYSAIQAGAAAGKNIQLNHGVNSVGQNQLQLN